MGINNNIGTARISRVCISQAVSYLVEMSPASLAHHFPPALFSFVVNDDDHELAHFTKSTFAYFLSGRVIITF